MVVHFSVVIKSVIDKLYVLYDTNSNFPMYLQDFKYKLNKGKTII